MKIFLVCTGGLRSNIEAAFTDEALARALAKEFPTGHVQTTDVLSESPVLYKYECWISQDTGEVLETNVGVPSLCPIVTDTSDNMIYALGSSDEDAMARAIEYRDTVLEDRRSLKSP